ncbi:MAG: DUF4276 family protein [Janthinobacterium lividum]
MSRNDIQIEIPQNAHGCTNLTNPGGIEKFVTNAWTKRDCGAVLVLMDADKKCPVRLATDFSQRVHAIGVRFPVVIVIAKCEYETWFLASLETVVDAPMESKLDLPIGLTYPGEVEGFAGVKGWITRQLPVGRSYKETMHQTSMTKLINLERVRQRSRSFRRLCHALEEAVNAIDQGLVIVTPKPPI